MKRSGIRVLTAPLAAFLLFLALSQGVDGQQPLTVAEASGFKATSRHADVLAFVRELQAESPLIRVETLCISAEGREVPLIVLGDPVPYSPQALIGDERAVVYFQANIHAGEVEGKEAALMLARDILRGKTPDYLSRLVILIAPIFNADGNERISAANRTNQVGPEQGVGIRYNGQNLDLNRDGMKLESPEAAGLVENVLNRWDPVFFLDSHTHNGSYHQEPVTWTWGLSPNGDAAVFDYIAGKMMNAINTRMAQQYNTLATLHGDFMDVQEPERGWVPLGPEPRYLSNYVGLRNRISILNEQYPYVDFETRVRGSYNLFLTFLDYLHEHRDEIVAMIREADRRSIARGLEPSAEDVFALSYNREPIDERITILGYEMEIAEEAGGRRRARPTDRKRTYSDVPYFARYAPARTVTFPRGYLIAVPDPDVLAKLLQHGLTVERLLEPATVEVESFAISQLVPAPRLNQGHYTNTVEGTYSPESVTFPAGSLFVSTAQPLGGIAAYLLEPESDDGLLYWNFFDRYLTRQFGGGAMVYPVYRVLNPVALVKETVRP